MFGTHSHWIGLRDRFGDRDVIVDSNGESVSRLRVATTLAVDESVLTARIAQLQSFDRSAFARPLGVDHDAETGRTILLAEHVPGLHLSEVFRHSSDGLVPDLSAVLFVVRRLLTAAERAQAATGLDHFGIASERVIVTPRAEVVVVDAAIAAAAESRIRVGDPPPGAHEDIANIARIGLSMVLGRLMSEDHYIDPLSSELDDMAEVATIRADETFASVLRLWFEQALVTDRDLSFHDFGAAREAFDVADPRAAGCQPSRRAFKTFLTDLGFDELFSAESTKLEARRITSLRARHLEKHWGTVEIAHAAEEVDRQLSSSDGAAGEPVVSPVLLEPESLFIDRSAQDVSESVIIDPLTQPEPSGHVSVEAPPGSVWAEQDPPDSVVDDAPQTSWLRRMFHRNQGSEEAAADTTHRGPSTEPEESVVHTESRDEPLILDAFSHGDRLANTANVDDAPAAGSAGTDEENSAGSAAEYEPASPLMHTSADQFGERELVSDSTDDNDAASDERPVAQSEPESAEDEEPARPSWLRRAFARARDRSEVPSVESASGHLADDEERVEDAAPFTFELDPAAHARGEESGHDSPSGDVGQEPPSGPVFDPSPTEEQPSEKPLSRETTAESVSFENIAAQVGLADDTSLEAATSGDSAFETVLSNRSTVDTAPHGRPPEPPAARALDGPSSEEPVPGASAASDPLIARAEEPMDDESDESDAEGEELEDDDAVPAGRNAFPPEWIRSAIAQLADPVAETAPETEVSEDEERAWDEIESSSLEENDEGFEEPDSQEHPADHLTPAGAVIPAVADIDTQEVEGAVPEAASSTPPPESWLRGALTRIRGKDPAAPQEQQPETHFETGPPDDRELEWTIAPDDHSSLKSLDSLFAAKAPPESAPPKTRLENEPRDGTPAGFDEPEPTTDTDPGDDATEPYDPIAELMASRPAGEALHSSLSDQHEAESSSIAESGHARQTHDESEEAPGVLGGWFARLMALRHKTEPADVPAPGPEEEPLAPPEPVSDPSAPARAAAALALPPEVNWTESPEEPPPARAQAPSEATLLAASAIAQAHLNKKAAAIPGPLALPLTAPETQARRSSGSWLKVAAVLFLVMGLGYGAYAFRELIPVPQVVAPEDPTESTDTSPPAESPTSGSLTVVSTPPGARVTIDGTSYGVTPLTVADLPPGEHSLLLEGSAGSVRRSVTVRAGATENVSEAIYSGFLAVFAPFELDILEQGQRVGTTDSARIMLPPGRHELELVNTRVGFRETRVVNIRPGETEVVNILP